MLLFRALTDMSTRQLEGPTDWKPAYDVDENLLDTIKGNASDDVKKHLIAILHLFMVNGKGFADTVGSKIKITEVWLQSKADEPERQESKVICEITVEEGALSYDPFPFVYQQTNCIH